jgi:acyl-coenzyme A thioesterase PaaI-like protein
VPLVHHELCFGCGRSNLFGLLLEAEWAGEGSVAGRCFIKQDHQGAEPGTAHEGILAAALSEAMALACGHGARASEVTVQLEGPAPVGGFLEVQARTVGALEAIATASSEGRVVARARGTYAASPR